MRCGRGCEDIWGRERTAPGYPVALEAFFQYNLHMSHQSETEKNLAAGKSVSIRVHGRSMWPLLKEKTDRAVIEPIEAVDITSSVVSSPPLNIRRGDIILFRRDGENPFRSDASAREDKCGTGKSDASAREDKCGAGKSDTSVQADKCGTDKPEALDSARANTPPSRISNDTPGILVLHRVVKVAPEGYYLIGDNQLKDRVEGPIRRDQICGRMTHRVRRGKTISVDSLYFRIRSAWAMFKHFLR